MYQSYSLTRSMDTGAQDDKLTTFTVSDDDAINCAHMLAAGFNTISRNFMHTFVMGVIDTQDGRVFYDGKVETIKRDEPWSVSQSFNFEGSTRGDTLLTLFGLDEQTVTTLRGDLKADDPQPSEHAHIAREVLEGSYREIGRIREQLEEAGVETIPPSEGVAELRAQINEHRKRESQNRSARAEMISFVKRAHAKKVRLQANGDHPNLDHRWRGMLDVLAKFLVVTGEADADEGHAIARKLCEVDDDEF
jgi:hypothetical protein